MATEYTHRQILADTLKLITIEKTTKKKKTKTINKYILLTILLSNVLSISISSFTTYLVTKEFQDKPNGSGFQDAHQRHVGLRVDGLRMDQGLPSDEGHHETRHTPSNHKKGHKTQYGVVHIDVSQGQNTTTENQDDEEDWWQ